MKKKNLVRILIIIFLLSALLLIYYKFNNRNKLSVETENTESTLNNSNIIQDVHYVSKDAKGNEYIIDAVIGEIDFENSNIIFLTDVKSKIILNNSNDVIIFSDYGKYNINNYDTIFSKNVIITYLDNIITGEYLDFSMARNTMIISRNVVYNNPENILKADVIEMNIKTKDTEIFMYEDKKKVNIKSKD